MKKATIFTLLTLLLTTAVQSQIAMVDTKPKKQPELKVEPKKNEPRSIKKESGVVFISEDNKTYVNKSLPIYLKFSTTPDGEIHDLKSLAHPEDAEPMYLDTEGPNYIRTKWAVDPETKEYALPLREVQMELFADSKPPMVRPVVSSTNRYQKQSTTFYGSDLSISLDDWDAQAGVRGSYWSLNGSMWAEGEAKFEGLESGNYSLQYYSVDNVNNYTEPVTVDFIYDKTAPKTDLLQTELGTFVFGPQTELQFKIEEEHSGVQATYYSISDLPFAKAGKDQMIPLQVEDGEYTIKYYTVDNVENQEPIGGREIYFDKTAPVTELSATESDLQGDLLYVSGSSVITLASSDNKAGVERVVFNASGYTNETYVDPFELPEWHGKTSVRYSATDKVGNAETVIKQNIFIDTLQPKTNIEFIGDYFEVANRFYVNGSTQIKLEGSDLNSGLAYIEYANIGSEFSKYESPFSLKKDGYYGMMYHSVDKVQNKEYSQSIDLYLDTKGPEIVFNFSNRPMSEESGVKVFPVGTRLFLGATDDQSGTNTISYKINDQNEIHYSSPKTIDISEKKAFKKGKTYEIKITSTDLVNNKTEETISFKIEE